MGRVYLDHAATTPMVAAAVAAMTAELTRVGNASSLHTSGRAARRVVEESRESIAAGLGARSSEVVFTSGATEADNLAVKGAYWHGRRRGRTGVAVSAVEHPAVLETAAWLEGEGARVRRLEVDPEGRLRLDALRATIDDTTAVVSVLWAANEVGVIQPVHRVAEAARSVGALAHSDAVQAVATVPVDFAASGLDLMSVSAHKLGGPYGIGALVARREAGLSPLLHGGGQERDVRSGTLDVAAVAGFAAALELAVGRRDGERERLRALRQQLRAVIASADPSAVFYGPGSEAERLPGLVTVGFPGCSAEAMLLLLDRAGIDSSTGSACSAGVAEASHVLLAMGVSEADARTTLRFSLGHSSTVADIDAVAAVLPEVLDRARVAGSLLGP